jgi:hypothetical protein
MISSPSRSDHVMRLFTLMCCLFVLASCGGAPRQPKHAGADDAMKMANDIISWHRQADTVFCDLMVRVAAPNRDALIFTINLWSPQDGRTRLKISKVGFDFCDAVVLPDGSFEAYLPRSNESVRGNVRELLGKDSAGNPAVMINEFKDGPLPVGVEVKPGEGTLLYSDPMTGCQAIATRADDGLGLKEKIIVLGVDALRIVYARYQDLDGLNRPTRVTITSPNDPLEVTVRVANIDALPVISAARMTVTIPDHAKPIPLAEFLRRIDE